MCSWHDIPRVTFIHKRYPHITSQEATTTGSSRSNVFYPSFVCNPENPSYVCGRILTKRPEMTVKCSRLSLASMHAHIEVMPMPAEGAAKREQRCGVRRAMPIGCCTKAGVWLRTGRRDAVGYRESEASIQSGADHFDERDVVL